MKYFVVFLLALFSLTGFAQEGEYTKISGVVVNEANLLPKSDVNVINLNTVKGTTTNGRGEFEIEAKANDTLHFSYIGFQSIKIRVSADWVKNKTGFKVKLTEKAHALEELFIPRYLLTGHIEVDTKLIALNDAHRYSISGLPYGYESGGSSSSQIGKVMQSLSNPADALYNIFGKKSKEMKKLKEFKKDETIRNVLASKYDRETVAAILGIDKKEIKEILNRCNYSDTFIETANDLQIMDAIKGCYEDYKLLKKNQ
ncbi:MULTISPECIES: carboxypeptidase-like regulatory domain-containing protein [Flavobacterium]|uniref:carboxypeptidase-like regulatory domain-containing protein n=1 Tax=Flavobacterium TaxID=237 RepID=UPI001FCC8EE9|nr:MULTISPECIES: carboxypeptidase-like regulatory domain-containing protein [Flavobacterium]UOK41312.1 carboxypeptidase-like regulatory domain-containing protein [Flavobacterium enshiense]